MRWSIERHPENGDHSWVVVATPKTGGPLWFAYETRREARRRLVQLREFSEEPRKAAKWIYDWMNGVLQKEH